MDLLLFRRFRPRECRVRIDRDEVCPSPWERGLGESGRGSQFPSFDFRPSTFDPRPSAFALRPLTSESVFENS
jgi:hypothetical protein